MVSKACNNIMPMDVYSIHACIAMDILSVYKMKFSTMILLAPLKVRLKTKRSPFTIC